MKAFALVNISILLLVVFNLSFASSQLMLDVRKKYPEYSKYSDLDFALIIKSLNDDYKQFTDNEFVAALGVRATTSEIGSANYKLIWSRNSPIKQSNETHKNSPVLKTLNSYEKGELAGGLGFGAMTLDAYYEICYSNGVRTDNNLNGINKLIKMKWDIEYLEIVARQKKHTGRNYRQEAHNLVNTAVKKTGGCNTPEMKRWFKEFQNTHENSLSKFHASH